MIHEVTRRDTKVSQLFVFLRMPWWILYWRSRITGHCRQQSLRLPAIYIPRNDAARDPAQYLPQRVVDGCIHTDFGPRMRYGLVQEFALGSRIAMRQPKLERRRLSTAPAGDLAAQHRVEQRRRHTPHGCR